MIQRQKGQLHAGGDTQLIGNVRLVVLDDPATVALALYLGYIASFRGGELLASGWIAMMDCSPASARELGVKAKRLGLIDLRMADDVLELGFERLDPWAGRL